MNFTHIQRAEQAQRELEEAYAKAGSVTEEALPPLLKSLPRRKPKPLLRLRSLRLRRRTKFLLRSQSRNL